MHKEKCMSPGNVQRFRDNDMHKNKELKRVEGTKFDARHFSGPNHGRHHPKLWGKRGEKTRLT